MLRLNLGSSDDLLPREQGWINVDAPWAQVPAWDGGKYDLQFIDLSKPWPWADSTIDEIRSWDCFEHIADKTHVLNESWRVLRPGAKLDLKVPCVHLRDGRVNPGAFADPTHKSFWTMDDQYYYCEEWNNHYGERGRLGPSYSIKALYRPQQWELIEYGKPCERRSKIVAVLIAVK